MHNFINQNATCFDCYWNISDILRMNMHVVYVQVNDKDRMYLNVLIKVGIKEGFISILLTPER